MKSGTAYIVLCLASPYAWAGDECLRRFMILMGMGRLFKLKIAKLMVLWIYLRLSTGRNTTLKGTASIFRKITLHRRGWGNAELNIDNIATYLYTGHDDSASLITSTLRMRKDPTDPATTFAEMVVRGMWNQIPLELNYRHSLPQLYRAVAAKWRLGYGDMVPLKEQPFSSFTASWSSLTMFIQRMPQFENGAEKRVIVLPRPVVRSIMHRIREPSVTNFPWEREVFVFYHQFRVVRVITIDDLTLYYVTVAGCTITDEELMHEIHHPSM